MKDIVAILEEYAADMPEETRKAIAGEVIKNYRTIDEVTKKAERIKELEADKGALEKQVTELAASGDEVDELKATVAQYQEKEEQRKAEAAKAAAREAFRAQFDAAVGDKKFANDLMRETVFDKAYVLCGETSGLGASDALEQVVKDVDGVWLNPQNDVNRMPSGDLKNDKKATNKKEFAKKLFGSLNS